jgi:hypothetical protein
MNNSDEGSNEPKVNLSERVLKDIGESWVAASISFRDGNIKDWYKNLKGITLNTIFLFSDQQKNQLKDIELKINKCLENTKPIGLQYPDKNRLINGAINIKAIKYVEEYNNTIKDFLHKAKFLFLTRIDEDKKCEM